MTGKLRNSQFDHASTDPASVERRLTWLAGQSRLHRHRVGGAKNLVCFALVAIQSLVQRHRVGGAKGG